MRQRSAGSQPEAATHTPTQHQKGQEGLLRASHVPAWAQPLPRRQQRPYLSENGP